MVKDANTIKRYKIKKNPEGTERDKTWGGDIRRGKKK